MPAFFDCFELSEDTRIEAIGLACLDGNRVGVCLEKNLPAKVARYIRKVTERYPKVTVLERIDGPTKGVVTIKFGLKPN